MIMPVRLLLSIVVALTFGVSAVGTIEIYVSPVGDDANAGTQQKPLASLARARDVVRQQKAEHPKEDVTVFLRGGVYRLTEPVVFTLADSGSAGLRFYSGDVRGSIIQRNVSYSCEPGQNATYDGSSRGGRPGPRLQDTNADYNLYYSTVDPDWGAAHLRKMRPLGIERHSLSADPLFVDIEKGNFRFQADSPALKLGIDQPLPIEEVGLREP